MCATPLRTILWCLMVMTFSSPFLVWFVLTEGRWNSRKQTQKKNFTCHDGSATEKIYSQYNCFIPFKLRSNPSHLSQWLCCNILIFSSGSIWINISKYKYQTTPSAEFRNSPGEIFRKFIKAALTPPDLVNCILRAVITGPLRRMTNVWLRLQRFGAIRQRWGMQPLS